ncbi:hypothetical protein JYK02_25210 [Corallococcus macrosporus]|uniref:DUF4435 domain-containing protein n=1 Tax=Corallococcus macrosporus TaxID=35 RepID=A0ABS3DHJ6_9BACT|nr:DUF3226 domain-containing protein [Corallococcus macrosporus]MBN8230819.1 hypothetical protein [Corallococcus macrosporus]
MTSAREQVLFVEGADDREVIYRICNHHSLDNKRLFAVEDKDGYENVREALQVKPRVLGMKAIGAVVDADEDLGPRWQSLRDALAYSGYTRLPELPDADGTIIPAQNDLPRIGIWLMPDNQIGGVLEDFLQRIIQQGDVLLPAAIDAVNGLPIRRFKPTYQTKATIHTWLAWQKEPGTPLGIAVSKHYLQADHELAQRFVAWMRRLFIPAPEAPTP